MNEEERKRRLLEVAAAQVHRRGNQDAALALKEMSHKGKITGTMLATVVEEMHDIEEFILPKVIKASEAKAFMRLNAQKSIRLRKRLDVFREIVSIIKTGTDTGESRNMYTALSQFDFADLNRTLDIVRDHLRQDEVPCHIVEDR